MHVCAPALLGIKVKFFETLLHIYQDSILKKIYQLYVIINPTIILLQHALLFLHLSACFHFGTILYF
jgi:hypothetical protein